MPAADDQTINKLKNYVFDRVDRDGGGDTGSLPIATIYKRIRLCLIKILVCHCKRFQAVVNKQRRILQTILIPLTSKCPH